ncbi:MAG: transcriptional regulator, partial [Methylomonas sp.]|nr:transcriptional regulator [Methylomonas sp.]
MNAIYQFGDFKLDSANQRLYRLDEALPLPPKVFQTLRYMIEHPARLVTKDQLLKEVWDGRVVTEGVLKSTMKLLRQALEDDSKAPRYLETVHRLGYRFIAEVRTSASVASPPTDAAVNRGLMPLVGRDTELGLLQSVLAKALE